ncbi:MAG: GDYXXLXY domain-containing protein [Robiginitomaculum sp.]
MKMKILRMGVIAAGLVFMLGYFTNHIKAMEFLRLSPHQVLLPLRPVDPRAFMQGDFMALAYAQSARPKVEGDDELPPKGIAVLSLDENGVGSFLRLSDQAAREHKDVITMKFTDNSRAPYGGARYFFEEGTAEAFEDADYGVFKVDGYGNAMLIGLADENFEIIVAQSPVNQNN